MLYYCDNISCALVQDITTTLHTDAPNRGQSVAVGVSVMVILLILTAVLVIVSYLILRRKSILKPSKLLVIALHSTHYMGVGR